mmetsp:Transcript_44614/g.51357  ORF Transcript_44614/g.51357 Transcript_44614/m.51357 type:complete len:87 (-) Transcript_44614:105-365(-)
MRESKIKDELIDELNFTLHNRSVDHSRGSYDFAEISSIQNPDSTQMEIKALKDEINRLRGKQTLEKEKCRSLEAENEEMQRKLEKI